MTTLEAGYATGNEQTVEILKAIQADGQKEYGEDSLLASQILLNMSAGEKVKYESDEPVNVETKKQETQETKEAA